MKKRLSLSLLFAIAMGITQPTWGSVLIEPWVGYLGGGSDGDRLEKTHRGSLYGAKLGYQSFVGLSAGLRYDQGDIATSSYDLDHQAYGVFLGYDLPLLLRLSVSYYLASKTERADAAIPSLEGKGLAVNVGMGILPLVKIFLEYQTHNDSDYKVKWYMLGLSLPLNI